MYSGSVVLGRIYCGMHSISDCVVGGLLGILTFVVHDLFGEDLELYMNNPSYFGEWGARDMSFLCS